MSTTPRERVGRAMRTGWDGRADLPDRVPVFCQLSVGHYFLWSGLDPLDIWFRSEGYAEALLRLARRYRFDGILVNLPGREPGYERHIAGIDRAGRETVVRWKDGSRTHVPLDDNPHHFAAGGRCALPRFEDVDPEDLWYVEPWDLTGISCPYRWGFEDSPRPPEGFFPEHHLRTLELVLAGSGGELSVHAEVFSPFSQLLELLGYEEALVALLDDPAKVRACLDRLTSGAADLARREAALGVDAVLISSAFAGAGFISREHYRSFVLPYEERLVGDILGTFPDLPVYTHTCGAIGDRLEEMLQTGTRGIDTLDPPPLGTVDLAEAKRILRGRAFIKGNLDPVGTLLRGDAGSVRRAAAERLRVAKEGGGYILSSACSVPPAAPPENLAILAGVAEEEGRYS